MPPDDEGGIRFDEATGYWFGTNDWVEYRPGTLPVILSAPHGGSTEPPSIPDRSGAGIVTVRDSRTIASMAWSRHRHHPGDEPYFSGGHYRGVDRPVELTGVRSEMKLRAAAIVAREDGRRRRALCPAGPTRARRT